MPFVHLMPVREKQEVGIIGAARILTTPEFFMSRYRNIAEFKKGPEVLQIGTFGAVPTESDLDALTFESGELQAFSQCVPGNCSVKTSVELRDRFHAEAGSNPPPERMASAMRRALADYVTTYLQGGEKNLIVYDDHRPAVRLADENRELLSEFPTLLQYASEFVNYLNAFPSSTLPGVESFVYWSKEKVGFKPVISITHVLIYKKMMQGAPWYFIASRQLYADHYVESSVALTVVSPGGSGSDLWMVYLNRSELDVLRGWLSGLTKSIIQGRAQSTMKRVLLATKKKLETGYRNAAASPS